MKSFTRKLGIFISLILAFPYQLEAANEKLVFALDLIRHGDRTSFNDLPNSPHTWEEGKGQLTAIGMQQAYQLGLKLNQRYRVDNQLLSTNYQAQSIYIRSTDYDRTMMTAESVLMGLYSLGTGPNLPDSTPALPSNFQPIPIHTVPMAQDRTFVIDFSSKEISALFDSYVYTRPDWKAKSAELEVHYNHWSQVTGRKIENMFDVLNVGDTLRTYIIHDIPLPAGLTKEEANTMIDAEDWILATLFKPPQIGDSVGKEALQNIMGYIQQAVEHKSNTQFILLSTHDVTILSVMSALHAPLDLSPVYASDLNFSLYESEGENYFVKVTYNDMPVNIPGCNANVCSLSQFLNRAK